jgi:hypothetical protein
MGISRKGRRRIEVDAHPYVWWVGEDLEACGAVTLNVCSEDKHLLVKYALAQADEDRHLVVLGREFRAKRPHGWGGYLRFRCPPFGTGETVAPRDVAALVRWCRTGTDPLVEVDSQGRVMDPSA